MSHQPFLIHIVEDNEWYNKLLAHHLSLNPDFVVERFFTGKDFLAALSKKTPSVVTLDYRLPDSNGEILLKKIKETNPNTEVIIVSEQEEIEIAIALLKAGAYDYIVKTKDIGGRLLNTINNIRKKNQLKTQIFTLNKEVTKKYAFENTIIGSSPAIKKIFDLISKATETNITVSISGETGTGKEVIAKAIHYNSSRKNNPFIAVNMAAIPSGLIESELFGHEKGAFTGADARRKGKFEEAANGTLLLDEISEMDLNLQTKLLRVLQEKEITRIGSNFPVKINCRIIIATNKNLQQEVKAGRFREDLYYRLIGLPIHLPPLCERDKDVLLLAKHFTDGFCKENNLPCKILSEDALKKILSHQWPGNIRELKSVIELSVVLSSSEEILPEHIVIETTDALTNVISNEMSLREYSRKIVMLYMAKYNNNTKIVAEKLNIGQTTVYRFLKENSKS
jgi:two-component system, NtrC family, response regulator AtoC